MILGLQSKPSAKLGLQLSLEAHLSLEGQPHPVCAWGQMELRNCSSGILTLLCLSLELMYLSAPLLEALPL